MFLEIIMIKTYTFKQLGHANHGWLNARHHFSFANYHNPDRMGFGALRVINDDIIKAGAGFDTHPHRDMEIITYVRKGAITHRDSHGNQGRTEAGDVQVRRAGTGLYHSEFYLEREDTTLYQIWIEPNNTGVQPRWDAKEFPTEEAEDGLTLLVSGDGRAPLQIHQDATLHAGPIKAGRELAHAIKHQAYLLVSKGAITLDGHSLNKGDGAEIRDKDSINLTAVTDAEVLIIDVPERARH
jgi:redox-sensitive bicupin YhaK (pirin superfamily)